MIAKGIHIGDNTHHHDQLITLHSLSVMNTIVSNPENPMPDEVEFSAITVLLLIIRYCNCEHYKRILLLQLMQEIQFLYSIGILLLRT